MENSHKAYCINLVSGWLYVCLSDVYLQRHTKRTSATEATRRFNMWPVCVLGQLCEPGTCDIFLLQRYLNYVAFARLALLALPRQREKYRHGATVHKQSMSHWRCLYVNHWVTLVYGISVFFDNKVEITPPSTHEQQTVYVLRLQVIERTTNNSFCPSHARYMAYRASLSRGVHCVANIQSIILPVISATTPRFRQ